jgi:thiamine-monophosphate kinase
MGLQLLEREKPVFDGDKDFQPDFAGKEYLLERQLKPEARKDIENLLAEHGIVPTSMIDVSDGGSSTCSISAHRVTPAASFSKSGYLSIIRLR